MPSLTSGLRVATRHRCIIILSYVRMPRVRISAGMCVARAGGAKRTSSNPNTTQPGLGGDPLRMDGAALAASPVRVVDRIVTPPLQRGRDIGRHAVSLDVTGEKGSRVRGFKGPSGIPADSGSDP